MSASYDLYKEEALRLLFSPQTLSDAVVRHIRALRCPLVPGVQCEIRTSASVTWENAAVIVAGEARVLEDRWSPFNSYVDERLKRQTRWLSRKLRRYGEALGASPILVSTNNGTVYFSYQVVVDQVSHIGDG